MIDRQHGTILLRCDSCDEGFENDYGPADFMRMIEDAKAAGWAIQRSGSEIKHSCPDCGERTNRLAKQRKLLGL